VPITVLLVDDQELMRMGLNMVLDAQDDITVVGEASDGAAAVAAVRTLEPDVVLMDVRMPVVDGVSATAQILESGVASRVLVMTTFDLDEHAMGALRAGASGFLLKDTPSEDLVSAIRSVAAGDAVVSPKVTRRLLAKFLDDGPGPLRDPEVLDVLTEREREVLQLVATGLSNTEIAGQLFLSESTIKSHVGRILTKLNVRDRVQAVVLAYETGLVRPGSYDGGWGSELRLDGEGADGRDHGARHGVGVADRAEHRRENGSLAGVDDLGQQRGIDERQLVVELDDPALERREVDPGDAEIGRLRDRDVGGDGLESELVRGDLGEEVRSALGARQRDRRGLVGDAAPEGGGRVHEVLWCGESDLEHVLRDEHAGAEKGVHGGGRGGGDLGGQRLQFGGTLREVGDRCCRCRSRGQHAEGGCGRENDCGSAEDGGTSHIGSSLCAGSEDPHRSELHHAQSLNVNLRVSIVSASISPAGRKTAPSSVERSDG
jgi:DNA-binding NarL/FixJ family response regulator